MQPTMRRYQDDVDYWKVRGFPREVSLLNDRRDFSWSLLRWDYWRWHGQENIEHFDLPSVIRLWEAQGRIAAVLNPEGPGEAFFQVHPQFTSEGLLAEMLDEAWKILAQTRADGVRELIAWVIEGDVVMKDLLARCGYARSKYKAEHIRRRPLSGPVPDVPTPAGYTVRALGDTGEHPAAELALLEGVPPR